MDDITVALNTNTHHTPSYTIKTSWDLNKGSYFCFKIIFDGNILILAKQWKNNVDLRLFNLLQTNSLGETKRQFDAKFDGRKPL